MNKTYIAALSVDSFFQVQLDTFDR